ncbi:hypothetical protein SKAU_G00157210 [Synaphobranchus kaupii]|uniref:Disks large-associated protein 4 n=1 Tax=Synaphobranchus kaupii TaxID=118154 RepID=A0A9Q1FHY3_SYNKA|nr:hypothetical protein SKAU_G00157210 [Synaphobranchus kaupii]
MPASLVLLPAPVVPWCLQQGVIIAEVVVTFMWAALPARFMAFPAPAPPVGPAQTALYPASPHWALAVSLYLVRINSLTSTAAAGRIMSSWNSLTLKPAGKLIWAWVTGTLYGWKPPSLKSGSAQKGRSARERDLQRPVSTCITTCKKAAPPPVPPRTTSKPYISVTVQSSTESAQDTYLDNHDRKSEANSQSGRSNSSDSIDSTRASSLAKVHRVPPPVTGPHDPPPRSSPPHETQHDTLRSTKGTLTAEEPRTNPAPRRKLSSIGIQVDCIQPVPKEETPPPPPPPPLTRFQSIGVQVEDGWQLSRSMSMASKQETDSDTQDLPNSTAKPSEKTMVNSACQSTDSPGPHHQGNGEGGGGASRQLSSRTATRSSSSSFSESLDPALDPSSLPPPDPWLESGNGSAPSGTAQPGAPACRQDGHWFLKLLQAETGRMEGWCQQMEQETKDNQLTEEVLGKVRSAVGCAQLLMSKKFQQFRGLCEQNLNVNANPRPTAQDLAGFWDLLQISIEDISMKFDELYHLKSNDWQLSESPDRKEDKKQAPPVSKKPSKAKPAGGREKSASNSDKQRQEARKRLMAAKRAASVRQNSATESADSIEIYVPEAQTRL